MSIYVIRLFAILVILVISHFGFDVRILVLIVPVPGRCSSYRYENTPMQYTAIFHARKNDNFRLNFFDYFHIFAQNINCGYTLEPPHCILYKSGV